MTQEVSTGLPPTLINAVEWKHVDSCNVVLSCSFCSMKRGAAVVRLGQSSAQVLTEGVFTVYTVSLEGVFV